MIFTYGHFAMKEYRCKFSSRWQPDVSVLQTISTCIYLWPCSPKRVATDKAPPTRPASALPLSTLNSLPITLSNRPILVHSKGLYYYWWSSGLPWHPPPHSCPIIYSFFTESSSFMLVTCPNHLRPSCFTHTNTLGTCTKLLM